MPAALGLVVLGLAWDLVLADGVAHYRGDGLFASAAVIAVASFMAWAAYWRGRAANEA